MQVVRERFGLDPKLIGQNEYDKQFVKDLLKCGPQQIAQLEQLIETWNFGKRYHMLMKFQKYAPGKVPAYIERLFMEALNKRKQPDKQIKQFLQYCQSVYQKSYTFPKEKPGLIGWVKSIFNKRNSHFQFDEQNVPLNKEE